MQGFDQGMWDGIDCSVAFQVFFQKFSKAPALREILLRQEGLFDELASKDSIWGTGVDRSDAVKTDPSKWLGDNMWDGL